MAVSPPRFAARRECRNLYPPPHPQRAMLAGLAGMTRAAAQHDVGGGKRCAAIAELDDVIAEEPDAGAAGILAERILAAAPAIMDDGGDERAPLARQIERIGALGRRLCGAGVDASHARGDFAERTVHATKIGSTATLSSSKPPRSSIAPAQRK